MGYLKSSHTFSYINMRERSKEEMEMEHCGVIKSSESSLCEDAARLRRKTRHALLLLAVMERATRSRRGRLHSGLSQK